VYERVASLGVADRCVVATDSDEVARAVRAAGAEVVLTSEAHPSGTDRVAEVVARREFAAYGVIVSVQGDEPFVDGDAVRGATSLVADGRFPLGTAAVPAGPEVLGHPDVVKVVRADDGRALYFSRAGIPFLRDPTDAPERERCIARHIGVYVYDRPALAAWVALEPHPLERVERLEQLRPLAAGLAIGVAMVDARAYDGWPHGGIDTEEDLARANAQWTELTAGRH
jgi:3-deoxy-manno-octulosonate cytidylyltransferase (CMP-KDO synthetase)